MFFTKPDEKEDSHLSVQWGMLAFEYNASDGHYVNTFVL